MFHKRFHEILFWIFLFLIPIQTRILYLPEKAYIDWYFNYHLAFFLYLSDLVFFACFLSWLIVSRETNLTWKHIFGHFLAYISLIFITLFHVKHLDLGLYQAIKWLELIMVLVYMSNIKDRRFINVSLGIILISGVLQAGLGITQFHVKHSLGLDFAGEYIAPIGTPGLATIDELSVKHPPVKHIRAYGTMPHPNVLAGFLVFSLIISYYFVSRLPAGQAGETSKHLKWLVSCGTLVLIFGIFFTFSRIGWLATGLVILGFLAFNGFTWNKRALALISGVLVVSGGIILFGYLNLLVSRGTESMNTSSIILREKYNQQGMELIKKYPILGVGVGNYVPAIREMFRLPPWQYQPAHNIYIFMAAELGILGLALFLIILFEIIRPVWYKKKQLLPFTLLLAAAVFLLIGLFDHYPLTIQQGRLTFFTILGFLLAQKNLES